MSFHRACCCITFSCDGAPPTLDVDLVGLDAGACPCGARHQAYGVIGTRPGASGADGSYSIAKVGQAIKYDGVWYCLYRSTNLFSIEQTVNCSTYKVNPKGIIQVWYDPVNEKLYSAAAAVELYDAGAPGMLVAHIDAAPTYELGVAHANENGACGYTRGSGAFTTYVSYGHYTSTGTIQVSKP